MSTTPMNPVEAAPREYVAQAFHRHSDGATAMVGTFYPDPAGWRWVAGSASGYLHAADWDVCELRPGDVFDVWSFDHGARLTVELVRINRCTLTTRIVGTMDTFKVIR